MLTQHGQLVLLQMIELPVVAIPSTLGSLGDLHHGPLSDLLAIPKNGQ